MPNTKSRRNFGKIRRLPSGRYQGSYQSADGERVNAPHTFERETQAADWLAGIRTDQLRGTLRQPKGKARTLAVYAEDWLAHRNLSPNSMRNYRHSLDAYILPELGSLNLSNIDAETVRKWYGKVGTSTGKAMQASAYRLLRALLATATEDEVIPSNPCKIRNGGQVDQKERVLLSTADVMHLAANVPERYCGLVLLGAFCGLRIGELIGLQRQDIDLDAGIVEVNWQLQRVGGRWIRSEPKSKAGKRIVYLPTFVTDALRLHLDKFVVNPVPTAGVFVTATGNPVYRADIRTMMIRAGKKIGKPAMFPHLLRHYALTAVAQAGATNAELLAFGGHSDLRVAMRYQHASNDRGRELANRVNSAFMLEANPNANIIEGELVS